MDDDRDGCDTRREVLIAESVSPVDVGPGCTIPGRWLSPYDGAEWTDPADVDVDHVVALSEAWDSGAHAWTAGERRALADDLGLDASLAAVTDDVNQAKSDLHPAQRVPPLVPARCDYAVDWVAVKYRWGLAADAAEVTALQRQLGACGPVVVEPPARARTAAPVPATAATDFPRGGELTAGASLVSTCGLFRFVVQGDGNLVVYGPAGARCTSRRTPATSPGS